MTPRGALLARQSCEGGGVGSVQSERSGRTALQSSVDIGSPVLSSEVMAEDFAKRREEDKPDYLIGTMR